MKKTPISRIIVSLVLTIPSIIWFVRFFSWEDNRICKDWQRTMHWNPDKQKPNFPCTWDKQTIETKSQDLATNQEAMTNQNFTISMDWPNNWMISKQYTCQWEWKFPDIKLTNIPSKTKTLALIIDDPDAPNWNRTHLLLANINFTGANKIINNSSIKESIVWKNSRGETNRWSPCPPSWTHRYFFKIFALDKKLALNTGFTKDEIIKSMENHILSEKELIWLYKKE